MDNESIRNVVMLELIAPEDPEQRLISEEEGKALYLRYNEGNRNWDYIFEPIKDENTRTKFKELFAYLDQQED